MQRYRFELTGTMPLIMHADNVEAADQLGEFRKDPQNKKNGVPGDDRSPAWTWFTYLYHDGEKVVMPNENIMACIRSGGAKITLKKQETFKRLTQSGILLEGETCDFAGPKGVVPIDKITPWYMAAPFADQKAKAAALGIDLLVKRASVGTSKHVRVRPTFREWTVRGVMIVVDPVITGETLGQILSLSGAYSGLGDWRPSSKTPGPFGRFEAKITKA